MEAALRSLLDWYAKVGIDVPEIAPSKPAPRRVPAKKTARPAPSAPAASPRPKPAAPVRAQMDLSKVKTLADLKSYIETFDAGALSDSARQAVFARGNPAADVMVIGEAPGRDEDIQGQPFVGPSGQLLNKMLAAIGLGEEDFYVTNVVNWRPPQNKGPRPEDIALCRPLIEKHIALAKPKILLLVGGVSLSAMTGQSGIMKHHGAWAEVSGLPAMPLYHPAFLLRRPELKKDAWRDLLAFRAKLSEISS